MKEGLLALLLAISSMSHSYAQATIGFSAGALLNKVNSKDNPTLSYNFPDFDFGIAVGTLLSGQVANKFLYQTELSYGYLKNTDLIESAPNSLLLDYERIIRAHLLNVGQLVKYDLGSGFIAVAGPELSIRFAESIDALDQSGTLIFEDFYRSPFNQFIMNFNIGMQYRVSKKVWLDFRYKRNLTRAGVITSESFLNMHSFLFSLVYFPFNNN